MRPNQKDNARKTHTNPSPAAMALAHHNRLLRKSTSYGDASVSDHTLSDIATLYRSIHTSGLSNPPMHVTTETNRALRHLAYLYKLAGTALQRIPYINEVLDIPFDDYSLNIVCQSKDPEVSDKSYRVKGKDFVASIEAHIERNVKESGYSRFIITESVTRTRIVCRSLVQVSAVLSFFKPFS